MIEQARRIAIEYYRLTGKPLGIIGKVGKYEAAQSPSLEEFVPAVIYEADRVVITAALLRRGSNARNERALAITEFRTIGRQVWPNREPSLPDGIAK